MYESVISARGRTIIFEGEVIQERRKDGTIHHVRVLGFRLEDVRVMERMGNKIVEASRTPPDANQVYKASVIVGGVKRKASGSVFFPSTWTVAQVEQAIAEAYLVKVAHRYKGNSCYEGLSNSGLHIVMKMDDAGLVLDAFPLPLAVTAKQALEWRVDTGRAKRNRHYCAKCGSLKVARRVCPKTADGLSNCAPIQFGAKWIKKRWRQLYRLLILIRDGSSCRYCGKRLGVTELTLDHVLPRSRGGGYNLRNLVACCEPCNSFKADRTPAEAGL
jgi:hypothetical protein